MKKAALVAAALLMPAAALAYPNGTPHYLTDTGPFCASCHSAVKTEYMADLPPEEAKKEVPEAKHYGLVRMPALPSPYAELTDAQKNDVINTARLIDANSSVSLSVPSTVKAGAELTVTVKARGGNGPVICLMLVDKALRYQSRPVSSSGWFITGEPEITGQDGKRQTAWLNRRLPGLAKNLNFVNIESEQFDPAKKVFPEGTVTFRLRAPSTPGEYTMAAAFLYGTENADKAAFFQRPSGRILFSEEARIQVE